jgi:hypothetical protein
VDGVVLATLADAGNGIFLFAEDVTQLIPIYGSLGNLLSRSLTTYRLTYRISTDVDGAFQAGRSVRGTLAVNAASNPSTCRSWCAFSDRAISSSAASVPVNAPEWRPPPRALYTPRPFPVRAPT